MKPPIDLRVYFVTDRRLCARLGLVETVLSAVAGGATLVQLRDPDAKGRDMLEMARALVAALAPFNVPLIVNDRPDIARAAGAAGVHVGQDDAPAEVARAIMGPDAVIGLSITDPSQIADTPDDVVDHLGVGPVFGGGVKTDAKPAIGLDGLRACVAATRKPVVAIGGVTLANARDCVAAGAAGVAVVSAIAAQTDPGLAARELLRAVDEALVRRRM
ncbi:MAG: thiamine-phosphate diphosphorylase [Rhizobiales bacterium 65-9]|nr:thiamine phosphate synthase [Hyphomicrobiales bacterium]OJY33230.1 MAG: thiamine-phosphate diphosphorylase [Rhizobiales bacterium 65-9]